MNGHTFAVHLPGSRGDIFQVAGLIECPVTPVAALLFIQHSEDALVCHDSAEVSRTSLEVIFKVGEHKVPQPRVVSLESVFARLSVPCVAVSGIEIHEEAVIALAELCVAVIVSDVPLEAVPRAEHHVLCSLIDTEEVVGKDVIGQNEVFVEILFDFVFELLALERGRLLAFAPEGTQERIQE